MRAAWLPVVAAILTFAVVAAEQHLSPIRFEDVAVSAALSFALQNSPTANKHMIETMVGGGLVSSMRTATGGLTFSLRTVRIFLRCVKAIPSIGTACTGTKET